MRLQFIVCKVMAEEARFCVNRSANDVDIILMEQGLHNEPERLRSEVRKALNKIRDDEGRSYDASLLGYGLCSNGIVGLSASVLLVVPRGHDCMTLLLGSKERYRQYFDSHKGIYWYSTGWIKTVSMPGKERYEQTLNEYIEKYGPDNAQFLMETEQNWMKEYNWAAYIDWGFEGSEEEKEYTKRCAEFMGWQYDELKADPGLMQRLVDGQWSDEEFLIVQPGQKIAEDLTSNGIIKTED